MAYSPQEAAILQQGMDEIHGITMQEQQLLPEFEQQIEMLGDAIVRNSKVVAGLADEAIRNVKT